MSQQRPATDGAAQRQVATKDPVQTAYALMESNKVQIAKALPKHLTADRMLRIVLTEMRKNPKLGQCDPLSIMGSVIIASQLGLEPGGALGHCYLIPYKRECTLQIGYRGMVDLARRSGNIVSIEARCVYEGDDVDHVYGTESYIRHRPLYKSTEITHVYAVAKLVGGGTQFDVMSIGEVNHIRDTYSSGWKFDKAGSPWTTAPDEMAKKTVVRRLFKLLPTSIEIRQATQIDDDEDQHNAKVIDAAYEVLPPSHDPSKMQAELDQPSAGESMQTPADKSKAEADRRVAVAELQKAMKLAADKGGNPDELLGVPQEQALLSWPADRLFAAADRLTSWASKK